MIPAIARLLERANLRTARGLNHLLRRDCGGAEGFALVELLAAMTIVALVAAAAVPRVVGLSEAAALERKVAEIVAILRVDRNAALKTGNAVYAGFDLHAGRVASGSTSRVAALPDGLFVEILRSRRASDGETSGFVFSPDGRASGGVVRLHGRRATHVISVNWLNSAITVTKEPAGGAS